MGKKMKRQAIQYAIIRFQPHVETEEFANVGVVMVVPALGYLDFKIETRRTARLTTFFDPLDGQLIRRILRDCKAELERIRELVGYNHQGQARFLLHPNESAERLFATITKDREGIVRYSDTRYALDENPTDLLGRLFDHYVAQNFVDAEYKEGLLEKHVRRLLNEQHEGARFQSRTYTDGLYTAQFPFVGEIGGREKIVLKPIYLGQQSPTKLFDHANKWLFRVNRLRNKLPGQVAFAAKGPASPGPANEAFKEVSTMFESDGIKVVRPEADALRSLVRGLQ